MSAKNLLIFTLAVIILISGGLLLNNLGDTSPYYYTVEEVLQEDFSSSENIRVAGYLVSDSITREGEILTFDIIDTAEENYLTVNYEGEKPEEFTQQEELIVEGRKDNNSFQANKVLMQCPSQYQEKLAE